MTDNPAPGHDGFHALVRAAQSGDRAAMDRVLEVLHPHIEPLARQYADPTKPVESTADLLQDACLRAWNKLDSFEGADTDEETFAMFRAWIGQIVRRQGMNARLGQKRKRRSPEGKVLSLDRENPAGTTTFGGGLAPPSPVGSPSTIVRGGERADRVRAALESIEDPQERALLQLVHFEKQTVKDAARQLDLTYRQALRRYQNAMDRLERDLRDLI